MMGIGGPVITAWLKFSKATLNAAHASTRLTILFICVLVAIRREGGVGA